MDNPAPIFIDVYFFDKKVIKIDKQQLNNSEVSFLCLEYKNREEDRCRNILIKEVYRRYKFWIRKKIGNKLGVITFSEWTSISLMAVARSMENYDSTKGAFSTYLNYWIMAMYQEFIRESLKIHIPHNIHVDITKFNNKNGVENTISEYISECSECGYEMSYESARESFRGDFLPDEYKNILAVNSNMLDLDMELVIGGLPIHEIIPQHTFESIENSYVATNITSILEDAVSKLPINESRVIKYMYCVGSTEENPIPLTLREIGDLMGYSHERIRQIRNKAFDFIKRSIAKRIEFNG